MGLNLAFKELMLILRSCCALVYCKTKRKYAFWRRQDICSSLVRRNFKNFYNLRRVGQHILKLPSASSLSRLGSHDFAWKMRD